MVTLMVGAEKQWVDRSI